MPHIRNGLFYFPFLAVIHNEDEERRKLMFSLYSKELTRVHQWQSQR